MGITCYQLKPTSRNQISLFDEINRQDRLTSAIDDLNSRYGNFIVGSTDVAKSHSIVKQKIPFGGVKYFELLLQSSKQA
jgi:hypothetical protein